MDKQKFIQKIIEADQADWNFPSSKNSLRVHDLEEEYESLFGEKAPKWPSRGRW